jgi:dihydroorotase
MDILELRALAGQGTPFDVIPCGAGHDASMLANGACLPVLKRERHRLALRRFATSGSPKVFLGTDSAPHLRKLKEATCGCAGIFSAPVALQSYLTVFDEEKALDKFEAFASIHGARFYGLPLNGSTLTLRRAPCEVSEDIALPGGGSIHPFLGGSTLPWMPEEDAVH